MSKRLTAVIAVLCAGTAAAAGAASADSTPQVSSNWAGYAAIAPAGAAVSFANATGTWVVPRVTCTSSRSDAVAFWVGLGGYSDDSTSLEQLGTAAECNGQSTTATYYAWWEIVPASSVRISLKVRPGDTITAAVAVQGQKVILSLKDATQHTRFSRVQVLSQQLDVSSAEWIAEAPASCTSATSCEVIPLTNFNGVTFTSIAATGNSHPGTLSDATWAATPIELITDENNGRAFDNADPLDSGVGAVPGALSADGRSFAVSWQQDLQPTG
jgi:hypothetical protein